MVLGFEFRRLLFIFWLVSVPRHRRYAAFCRFSATAEMPFIRSVMCLSFVSLVDAVMHDGGGWRQRRVRGSTLPCCKRAVAPIQHGFFLCRSVSR